jgi:hypothetical protein
MAEKPTVHEAMVKKAATDLQGLPWREWTEEQISDFCITAGNQYLESIGPHEMTFTVDDLEDT